MKKKIVVGVFTLLILITVICFIISAISSYNYDMNPANGVDIFEGLNAVLILIFGGFVVLYEIDLFYTVYYFLIKPKILAKTILNILSNLSFVSFYVIICFWDLIISVKLFEGLLLGLFALYIVLRIVYLCVSTHIDECEE